MKVVLYDYHPYNYDANDVHSFEIENDSMVEIHLKEGALRLSVSRDGYYTLIKFPSSLSKHRNQSVATIASNYIHHEDPRWDLVRSLYQRISGLQQKKGMFKHEDLESLVDLARRAAGVDKPEVDAALKSVRTEALKKAKKLKLERKGAITKMPLSAWMAADRAGLYEIPFVELPEADRTLLNNAGYYLRLEDCLEAKTLLDGAHRLHDGTVAYPLSTPQENSVPRVFLDSLGRPVLAFALPVSLAD